MAFYNLGYLVFQVKALENFLKSLSCVYIRTRFLFGLGLGLRLEF